VILFHMNICSPTPARQKRGFSLIEAAIVLAIVGLVIGGIWMAASAVNAAQRVNRTNEQVGYVVQKMRSLFKGHIPDYEMYALLEAGTCPPLVNCFGRNGWPTVMPPDMISAGSDYPVNPYGHEYGFSMMQDRIMVTINLGNDVKACARLGPLLYNAYHNETLPDGTPVDVILAGSGTSISSPTGAGAACEGELQNVGLVAIGFSIRA